MSQNYNQKIEALLATSQQVFLDCALDNGGLVAANSTKDYYSHEVNNYFYVWPRDGAYTCLASDSLGMTDLQLNFFTWLVERAEAWPEMGLFFENYAPNGRQHFSRFQPDQTSTVLWAASQFLKTNPGYKQKLARLIKHSASGLVRAWDQDHFTIITCNLWEERQGFPDAKDNFCYSLASCIRGLEEANQLFPSKQVAKTASQMRVLLTNQLKQMKYIYRSFGQLNDERIDASALGLIWPFEIVPAKSKLAQNTVKVIQAKIAKHYGVNRYEFDLYDSRMVRREHRKTGAGYWPLLNFWLSLVLQKQGKTREARKYYFQVLDQVDTYIPEQIFTNHIQVSISPLCWSHAMFILASQELGFLK